MDLQITCSIIALMLSILALFVSWRSYKDRHKHKRLFDTLEIIRAWDSETMVLSRAKISQLKDFHTVIIPEALPYEMIIEARKKDFEEKESITISDHINNILNYMEVVSVGIRIGIYDEELIKQNLGQPFNRLYYALEDYRNKLVSPRLRFKNPWPEVSILVEKWSEQEKLKSTRPPGGHDA